MAAYKLNARAIERMERMWMYGQNGVPVSNLDLAVEFDVSKNAINYHVRKFRAKGLTREVWPRRGRPRSFDYDKARALVANGLPHKEVADRFGVSLPRIYQIARAA